MLISNLNLSEAILDIYFSIKYKSNFVIQILNKSTNCE